MILKLDQIHTYYGLVHTLRGVSMAIQSGEFVGILGRNGAGKSTTIKSVMGLVPPERGQIWFQGEDITGRPPYEIARRGIAYVPGTRGVFSQLTALENVRMVEQKGTRFDLEEAFRRYPKLEELKHRKGRFLSGGERQMVAIARALATHPQLLLFDEPSQGLSPTAVRSVIDMLRQIKAEGQVSLVLVEQRVDIALALVDRVLILDQGQIVFEGTPTQLAQDPELQQAFLGLGV